MKESVQMRHESEPVLHSVPAPIQVTEEERLRLQNFELRAQVLQLRKEKLIRDSMELQQEEDSLRQEHLQLRTILANKYNIPVEKMTITRSGMLEAKP